MLPAWLPSLNLEDYKQFTASHPMTCLAGAGVGLLSYLIWRFLKADADLTVLAADAFYSKNKMRSCFSGKVVWITGASSGLGRALAVYLCQFGPKLVLSARREGELDNVKQECLQINSELSEADILVLPMDSLNFDKLPELVSTVISKFEKIDILVNNAGRSQRSLAETTPIEVDRAVMELNLLGYVALTKAVLPTMIEQKSGCIVALSSVAGKMGSPIGTAYSASKFAVMGFFNALRAEVYQHGIDVCTLCPGPTRSDISLHSFTETVEKEYNQDVKNEGNKLETDRFARLAGVSIAARIPEAWISIQPYLLYLYLAQYFPTIVTSQIFLKGSQGRIQKFRNNECLY